MIILSLFPALYCFCCTSPINSSIIHDILCFITLPICVSRLFIASSPSLMSMCFSHLFHSKALYLFLPIVFRLSPSHLFFPLLAKCPLSLFLISFPSLVPPLCFSSIHLILFMLQKTGKKRKWKCVCTPAQTSVNCVDTSAPQSVLDVCIYTNVLLMFLFIFPETAAHFFPLRMFCLLQKQS